MPLTVGTRLGHYDVVALIGEGGMGQVWQATDTQLNRQVALKILPDAFADDPDRLARFQREAHVLASLNHPGIAAIYGIEKSGDTQALVLELVEGPTLADRIEQGPIPVDEALPIAKQIAEALETAHEAGVIHRDLKPANIKVREDGTVKVLDFGLAKALDTTPQGDPDQSPTLTAAATQMGVIMGTAAYMSPEQARGKPVDKRADIWAYGVVLYEMLSGARPFQGEDVSLTLASVMKSDISVAALPPDVPWAVRTVLHRCLQKDPRERIRDIGDARLALGGAFDPVAASSPRAARPAAHRLATAFGVVGVVAFLGAIAIWNGRPDTGAERDLVISVVPTGELRALAPDFAQPTIAISPDGATVVFRAVAADGTPALYRRHLDSLTAERLVGAESGVGPVFSPDGTSVAFLSTLFGRVLVQKVPVNGGPATNVATLPGIGAGLSWGTDDWIVIGQQDGGLVRAQPGGGSAPQPLTEVAATGESSHRWPFTIPNSRTVLFATTTADQGGVSQLAAVDLDGGGVVELGLLGTAPRYVDGHLVYVDDQGALQAVAFDVDRLGTTGRSVALAPGVASRVTGAAEWAVSDTRRLLYVAGEAGALPGATLQWVDRDGQVLASDVSPPGVIVWPRLSPGERLIAYGTGRQILVFDPQRGIGDPVTFDGFNVAPVWGPDDSTLLFTSVRDGAFGLYSKGLADVADATLLVEEAGAVTACASQRPNQPLLYQRLLAIGRRDLWSLAVGGVPTPFLESEFDDVCPVLSPDGRWVAYVSDRSGERRVYARSFPDGTRDLPISSGRGTEPTWSHDGRELYYRDGPRMMVVEVDPTGELAVSTGRALFEGEYLADPTGAGLRNYDVSSDGRFLMLSSSTSQGTFAPGTMMLVQNWQTRLERTGPAN